eukprot:263629_1
MGPPTAATETASKQPTIVQTIERKPMLHLVLAATHLGLYRNITVSGTPERCIAGHSMYGGITQQSQWSRLANAKEGSSDDFMMNFAKCVISTRASYGYVPTTYWMALWK